VNDAAFGSSPAEGRSHFLVVKQATSGAAQLHDVARDSTFVWAFFDLRFTSAY